MKTEVWKVVTSPTTTLGHMTLQSLIRRFSGSLARTAAGGREHIFLPPPRLLSTRDSFQSLFDRVSRRKMGSVPGCGGPPKVQANVANLFQDIESAVESTSLGKEKWYILTIAALVGGTEPELADQLYLYIINKPEYATTSHRHYLIRRLREALVKLVSIVGVCKPLEAIIAIMKVEKEEDRDYTFTRENWQCDQENHDRGMEWMRQIYAHNIEPTLDLFKAHQDFRWISTEITYGLYLSDRKILDDLDTELVVLVGIMVQNLRLETHWHIRGTRRIGVSKGDVEIIVACVHKVANFMGTSLNRIPTVEEVEKDV
ncbi:uncharacterized protein BDR25DRAFT_340949 [Lindgomyces ingoldianus]|uniref:Uncharacterized protein n=1 Tax=Lindgomyces ingoldianus TaxID=673940 RepID=A0ACB6R2X1_9PLEO|nr:uncharacterized protein BDR25DRAFT_340949 [Lindgomyces ingoldianus]KAF2473604.1 hypothetical protein BDR25DRAFT_340949 [Lindgomyces ingoldianus]